MGMRKEHEQEGGGSGNEEGPWGDEGQGNGNEEGTWGWGEGMGMRKEHGRMRDEGGTWGGGDEAGTQEVGMREGE